MPKNNPTKMESENNELERASRGSFFIDKKSIKEISVEIGISRKSISKHLNSLTTYNDERNYRKIINQKKRKEYKRNWDSENRANRYSVIDKDTIKREHIMAVSILSREKYR